MSYVLLTAEHVLAIHDEILEPTELQGLAGNKSLDGAIGRVTNRLAYGLIDDVYALAAAYAAAIAQAHCFNDGNKRTAFQVMDIVLCLNGVVLEWEAEAVGDRIVLLAQSQSDAEQFAKWLRQLVGIPAVSP